ncbi:MAG: hypothetical protein A2170_07890 [Deltaproteobacteria bacterium RBG_13_53_10]|nr:MAG: hypothetical protein A2170_07890 [Deltaproteobacteria bacterium RBG_13_53_10]
MCQQLTFDLSFDFKYSLYIQQLKDRLKVLQERSTKEILEKELELVEEKCENLTRTKLDISEDDENIKKSERKIDSTETRRKGGGVRNQLPSSPAKKGMKN